jgi:hypothetical protein
VCGGGAKRVPVCPCWDESELENITAENFSSDYSCTPMDSNGGTIVHIETGYTTEGLMFYVQENWEVGNDRICAAVPRVIILIIKVASGLRM